MNIQEALLVYSKLKKITKRFYLAGSARRGKSENLHDLDIVYLGNQIPILQLEKIGFKFTMVGEKIVRGTLNNKPIDIYKAEPKYFGAMMLFLTGSQKYNLKMRAKAKYKGMKLSQYGLFNRETNEYIAGRREEDIYLAMGLEYKKPEDRK
jgi:DNA polymerase (family 10)